MSSRLKDREWVFDSDPNGNYIHADIQIALLMDLRDELKKLNSLFYCKNFIEIPKTLNRISRNTAKKRRKK